MTGMISAKTGAAQYEPSASGVNKIDITAPKYIGCRTIR